MSENKKDDSENYVQPPSLFDMITTFTKEVSTYIAEGAPNVSTEDYIDRLDTCNGCAHFIKKSMRCGKCGCLMQHKAKWKTSKCPLDQGAPQEGYESCESELYPEKEKLRAEQIKDTEFQKQHAKGQEDNNTDSSNKI